MKKQMVILIKRRKFNVLMVSNQESAVAGDTYADSGAHMGAKPTRFNKNDGEPYLQTAADIRVTALGFFNVKA